MTGTDYLEKVTLSALVTPDMANFSGQLHGGHLLRIADHAAYVAACRHAGEYCVTASFDKVDFHQSVNVGELLTFLARVVNVGTTSMQVKIEVAAEELRSRSVRKVNTCLATLVALRDGDPVEVPPLRCDTEEKRRECIKAHRRKQLAEEYEERIQEMKQNIEEMSDEDIKERMRATGKEF